MTEGRRRVSRGPLFKQLRWFITLRWVAVSTLIVGAVVERQSGWFGGRDEAFLAVAAAILVYNVAMSLALPRVRRRGFLRALAWAQLLLDMLALTALVIWTGGVRSPLIAFFVFHMVFASLLLPQVFAYASAIAASALIAAGLAVTDHWPDNRVDTLNLAGMLITLVLTVMLTNRITRDLRAHRRRLTRQNRRIKAMSDQLRRQQQAFVQHEKMVAMGRMAAGVTHEICNPLASIDSLLQLAQRRPERMQPQSIQTLREQVQRINQIIQQMKTFAHPTEMQTQTLPLNDLLEQALAMVRFDPRLKNVELRREFDSAAGSVVVLPQAFQQVLVNLIVNALDAMAQTESPVLTLRTHRREGWCVVDVIDNGHGIEPRQLSRLFEPFFTTKPVGKGTGLGLSISYSLMQKQGGSISVRSQPGHGATFTLRLPAVPCSSRRRETLGARIGGGENSQP